MMFVSTPARAPADLSNCLLQVLIDLFPWPGLLKLPSRVCLTISDSIIGNIKLNLLVNLSLGQIVKNPIQI